MPDPQAIIGNLLAALIGQSDPEKYKNPVYGRDTTEDDEGNILDRNGNIIGDIGSYKNEPLYTQPSFGTKLMHPEVVNYINNANANWANEPIQASRQRDLEKESMISRHATGNMLMGKDIGQTLQAWRDNTPVTDPSISPETAALILKQTPEMSGTTKYQSDVGQGVQALQSSNAAQSLKEDTANSIARIAAGLPVSNAETALSSNIYSNQQRKALMPNLELNAANDRARMAYEDAVRPGQLKVAQTSNDVLVKENQRKLNGATALDQITKNDYDTQLASSTTEVALANAKKDAIAKLKTTLNNSIDENVNNSARSLGLSEQNLKNLKADQTTLGNTSLLRAFGSRYDAPIPTFATHINDDGNVSVSNTGFDSPAIANMQSLSASLGKKPVQLKDKTTGKTYAMPIAEPEYDPVSGKRVINAQKSPGKPSATEASANSVDDEFAQNLSKVEPLKKPLVIRQVASELVKALNIPTESKALQIGSSKFYRDPALVIYEALVDGESHGFKGADIVKQFNALPDNVKRAIYSKALSSVTGKSQKPIGSRPLN